MNQIRIVENPDLQPISTTSAAAVLDGYVTQLINGTVTQLLPQNSDLEGFEVGPGLITILGAYPGMGKTALTSQIMFDALSLKPDLTAVVANAETGFDVLLRRQLTRITRIPSKAIRFGLLTDEEKTTIKAAAGELRPKLERVSVLNHPHTILNLLTLLDKQPGLLIVDYLQLFLAPESKDARIGVNGVMNGLRRLAKAGWSVIAISATSRPTKDNKLLTIHSLRESSEIEFQADSIYLLHDMGPVSTDKEWLRNVTLEHAKNRHDQPVDFELEFHRPRMEFAKRVVVSEFAGDFAPGSFDLFGGSDER
jgi:replicative DNA helicase